MNAEIIRKSTIPPSMRGLLFKLLCNGQSLQFRIIYIYEHTCIIKPVLKLTTVQVKAKQQKQKHNHTYSL